MADNTPIGPNEKKQTFGLQVKKNRVIARKSAIIFCCKRIFLYFCSVKKQICMAQKIDILVGRKVEQETLHQIVESNEAEFVVSRILV